MITAAFLAAPAASLAFGAWLTTRWVRADQRDVSILSTEQRAWDVCDEAANAETACDWGGSI
jgi:hypothetical protein